MKFAEDIFPKGTFKGQETDGAYINETLAKNLDVIAKKIGDDMHFLGIISGHDMVGDGKTTMATHVGAYLTHKVNQCWKVNNQFTDKNMVFNSVELVERSFELPPYSIIVLDEGDDLTTHGMKELAVRLKRFFRKCRQLNHILLLILPSFFELPKFYALSRSHFLIDVMFMNEFERGYFKFYGAHSKKLLYIKGKKEWDYDSWKPDFKGRFFSSYVFFPDLKGCTDRYKEHKLSDMHDDSDEKIDKRTKAQIEQDIKVKLFKQVHVNSTLSVKELSRQFGINIRTGFKWLEAENDRELDEASRVRVLCKVQQNETIPQRDVDVMEEEEEERKKDESNNTL
jgi:hypothetical protein